MRILLFLVIFILSTMEGISQEPSKAETTEVNGKKIYYEVYGKGEPIFLLHGFTLSSKSWVSYVDDFSDNYEVYLVDLTGHGKSDPFNEKLSIKSVAQDLKALVDYLKLDKFKAIGFSYGGDVLFQFALHYPNVIESMVTIGALGSWNVDDYPHFKDEFNLKNIDKFPWIKELHASEKHITSLFEQFLNYKVRLTDEELQRIKTEVLLILGDDDEAMPLEETLRVRKNLPNSDLWILPNVSHGAHEGEYKGEFIRISRDFLLK